METDNVLYQNDNYKVVVDPAVKILIEGNEFVGGYNLINLSTNITEFSTPCYPEALRLAVHWDVALANDSHLWPYKQQAAAEEFGNPAEFLQ